jgi:hypothetical protein
MAVRHACELDFLHAHPPLDSHELGIARIVVDHMDGWHRGAVPDGGTMWIHGTSYQRHMPYWRSLTTSCLYSSLSLAEFRCQSWWLLTYVRQRATIAW